MTNGEKLRQMTDEELAVELEAFVCDKVIECRAEDISCTECALKWLKQEAKENESNKY